MRQNYDWVSRPKLEDHTKKKHDILTRYFRRYLLTRCQLPMQEKFRLAIVDGFSGGGLYQCGSYGSPIIFVDTLVKTASEINLRRENENMRPIHIECLLVLNDSKKPAINELRTNIAPHLANALDSAPNLTINVEFYNDEFSIIYPSLKERLLAARCMNVIFNLDQCGYSLVTSDVIKDIISSWPSSEVILTFVIEAMLTYLSSDKKNNSVPLEPAVRKKIAALLEGKIIGRKEWLREAEKIVFDHMKSCAPYTSPFSINNPDGWYYWLMHFANKFTARQVYNDVLHEDGALQAHSGKFGLNMMSYDPRDELRLYLFDDDSRVLSKEALHDDIPKLVAEAGDAISMRDFYAAAYSETTAHSDDIHEMIIENPDLEVITGSGGERRRPNTIRADDTLRIINQKNFYFMFPTKSDSE